ncbi:DMT family transporter [Pseudomonas fluorescens]|uniref:IS1595 family transposase ISBsp7 n=1 Tax=Pseudomonas fluorescens TaxID=294 RepID=A0A5E7DEY8_PSEFL|nr:DMT family transporter [Pseudomonas fluorescens]VVO05992.1 IS1595 family transposase ISBsp7 [Pseudomonas fluorescens]VVO37404.1 IS1595 family transposase ISBsp7 [Pseudomonas fluorescens]VVO45057.1 IS1595 family transposase ISBsp7 [Pseudomonas fluorescens]VVO45062.1 IS1595 family transposase ISBsp7 [Pseudomonas fluorescens]
MNPVDILRMLALSAIWGASFLFMRIIAPEIGTIPTAFFRVSIAAGGLLVILALMRISWDFRGKFKTVLLLGVINSGIPATMYSVAAQVLPAGYSAIFNATTPLMGVLIGGVFFSEKLTPAKIAGVCLGLFGVGILTRAGPVAFDLELLMGALACLLATTCYGFAGFLARRWLDQQGGLDSRLSALGSMLGATLFLLPLFGYNAISQPPASWGGWNVWLSLLGLGLVCTAFAYILYFRLLSSIGPVKSMTVTFMIPPFGVLWGALFLDEPLSMAHVYGSVLIAGALWLVLKPTVATVATVATVSKVTAR